MCDELVWEIQGVLESFNGEESLKEIFWSILSYDQQRLPLGNIDLRRDVSAAVESLELFASHDSIGVIRVGCCVRLRQDLIESLCSSLESRFPSVLLVLHVAEANEWTIVYPDRSRTHHLRFLALPGCPGDLPTTARALAALTAVDWNSDDTLRRLDVAHQMDVYFPGGMPKQRWEFDPSLENTEYSDSYMRRKAEPVADLYHDISRYPLLTQQQERGEDLDESMCSSEKMNEYHWRLVVHNIRLVINIALTFPTNVLDLDDLVQEGILGLISAARKFDKSRGNRFTTYAWYWIRQGIFRAISQNHNLIRWPAHRTAELVPANRDDAMFSLSPGERYVQQLEKSDIEHSDAIDNPDEDLLEREESIEALLSSLESLDDRQQRILRLRFGFGATEEMTLEEVGQLEGITRERIRQIQIDAVGKLKYALPPWMRAQFEQSGEDEQAEN